VDEAVFRKQHLPGNEVLWNEYVGLKRRGDRGSLFLQKRPSSHNKSSIVKSGRSAPPPMSVPEWQRLQDARVGERSLVHSDGARAYNNLRVGVLHDSVSHSSRNGCPPQYTKMVTHKLPDGSKHACVAGTQSLDGWLGWAKKNMHGVKAQSPKRVDEHLKEEQWRHWLGCADRWAEAGKVLSWIPEE
jgi:hypothetical protein